MSEPSIQERIQQLREENRMLAAANVTLQAEITSLQQQVETVTANLTATQRGFTDALARMEQRFTDLLALQATETKDLLTASHADTAHILNSLDHALDDLKATQTKYDQLKTEFNQYQRSHP